MTERARKLVAIIGGMTLFVAAAGFYVFFDYARASSFCDGVPDGSDAAETLNGAQHQAVRVTDGAYKNERRVVFGKCYCALYLEGTTVGWSRVLCAR